MNIYEIIGLNKELLSISAMAEKYDAILSSEQERYDGMIREVESSCKESQEYWTQFSQSNRLTSGQKAGALIDAIENTIQRMKEIMDELSNIDRGFNRFRNNYVYTQFVVEGEENVDEDYYSVVKSLYTSLFKVANECSKTARSFPLMKIGAALSGKQRGRYKSIVDNYYEAERIADLACDILPKKTTDYWRRIEAKSSFEIEKAINESTDLIMEISEEEETVFAETCENFKNELEELISSDRMIALSNYTSQGNVDHKAVPDSFSEGIPVGYYARDYFPEIRNPQLLNVLIDAYEPLISQNTVILPAVLDGKLANNIVIKTTSDDYDLYARDFVLSLFFSLLSSRPAGYQHFYLIDPEKRGESFKPVLEIINKVPTVMGGKVLTTQDQIDTALKKLIDYIDDSAQRKYIGYNDIFEYNAVVKEKQEPYQELVVMDFPKYFNEQMLDSLWNIINTGKAYGIGVILQFNENYIEKRASDRYFELIRKIEAAASCYTEYNRLWVDCNNVVLLPSEFDQSLFSAFATDFYNKFENKRKAGIEITRVLELDKLGMGVSADELSIPFGIDEKGEIIKMEFGDPVASGISHYALVTGSLGSGKSTLLHTLIMSSIIKYSPEELNVFLMDFKKGTEFKIYSEYQVPHIKLLAMDAMQEFGQSILLELKEEMNRRAELFKSASAELGVDIRSISDYRNTTKRTLPRILVVVDEFQLLFDSDANRKVASSCGKLMADLISLARVYGIHFVFATQTLSRIYSGNYTILKASLNEMHVRIGLKGTEQEAELLFGTEGGRIAVTKYGDEKGLGAYMADDTAGSPVGFRCAFCPAELQKRLLIDINELYGHRAAATRFFSGSYTPKLESSKAYNSNKLGDCFIAFGEPIKVSDELVVEFSNKKRSNVLIVGSDLSMRNNLVQLSLVGFKNTFSKDSIVKLIDGDYITGGEVDQLTTSIIGELNNCQIVTKEQDVLRALDEAYEWYRKKKETSKRDGTHFLIIINNMQWIDTINKILKGKSVDEYKNNNSAHDDSSNLFDYVAKDNPNDLTAMFDAFNDSLSGETSFTDGTINYHGVLCELLSDGYMYGVNFVITASGFSDIKEYMYEIGSSLPNRILFGISDIDADRLSPDTKTQSLPSNVVIFANAKNDSFQFKPFAIE